MKDEENVIYREIQRPRQWWYILIIIFLVCTTWYGAVRQLIFEKPFGTNPASDTGMLIILVLAGVLFPIFLISLKMETFVKKDGIYVRFFPLHLKPKRFSFEDIKTQEAIYYKPIREYGGWGIRWGRNGKAYSISGNLGLQLTFKNGKKLLIGSQNPKELERVMNNNVSST